MKRYRVFRASLFAAIISGPLCSISAMPAAAAEPHIVYFNGGVLGANESKIEPRPVLLPSPQLKVGFFQTPELHLSEVEIKFAGDLARRVDSVIGLSGKALEVIDAPFTLESVGAMQPFEAMQMVEGELAILIADVKRHGAEMKSVLDEAYMPLARRHPGLFTEPVAIFKCGLYLFRTRQQAISAILFVPPDETLAAASYCINFAILQTVGFRGRVTSLPEDACKSVRCASRPKTRIAAWDLLAISALYSVDGPQPLSSLFRFKEVFNAAPESFQSPR